jgi:hypothetical protein
VASNVSGRARLLLIGLGDLGRRLALGLAASSEVAELVVASRRAEDGALFAALAAASGAASVRFEPLDCLDVDATAALVLREQPDLIVQCAALLSPWEIARRSTRAGHAGHAARVLAGAGFAVQLPAHVPAVMAVMQAVRAAGFRNPVVNCSFPDVTHPILARLDLAPTIGIGNVGMIAAVVGSTLRTLGRPSQRVRVLAHHSHVTAAMTRDPSRSAGGCHPRVFLDDAGTPADDLVYRGQPLASSQDLNVLTCAHGLDVIRALLPGGGPLATSAPGPNGLPGGWPVQIAHGRVELDLPQALPYEVALRACEAAAAGDGIARIAEDGTVYFSEAAQRAVAPLHPELTAPLAPADCLSRFALLRRTLMDPT